MRVAKLDRYDFINNPMDDSASFTVWFSGCTFKCEGCHNEVLWNPDYGILFSPHELANIIIKECNTTGVKSVVLIGGEPLQQNIRELLYLCQALKRGHDIKIWLYTGYDFDVVEDEYMGILNTIDVIKCGRYDSSLECTGFPASSNQRVYKCIKDKWEDITKHLS